jgi:hypothetical protein
MAIYGEAKFPAHYWVKGKHTIAVWIGKVPPSSQDKGVIWKLSQRSRNEHRKVRKNGLAIPWVQKSVGVLPFRKL